jgi:hypothetical protein
MVRVEGKRPRTEPQNNKPAEDGLHQMALSGKLSGVILGSHLWLVIIKFDTGSQRYEIPRPAGQDKGPDKQVVPLQFVAGVVH